MGMRATTLVLGVGFAVLTGSSEARSQQVHRNGLEARHGEHERRDCVHPPHLRT